MKHSPSTRPLIPGGGVESIQKNLVFFASRFNKDFTIKEVDILIGEIHPSPEDKE